MNTDPPRIAGIVLAAGEGKRIGGNKALMKIEGATFLERIVGAMREAGCDPVTVVVGSETEVVRESARRLNVELAVNKLWEKGMFSSLKVGLAEAGSGCDGAMIALVDHPLVALGTYRALRDAFLVSPGRIVIPVHRGKRGHPVMIPRAVSAEVLAASDDSNLRDILHRHPEMIHEVTVDDPGILHDIDTPDDLGRT